MKESYIKFNREKYNAEFDLKTVDKNQYELHAIYKDPETNAATLLVFSLRISDHGNVYFNCPGVLEGHGAGSSMDDAIAQCAAAGFAKLQYRVPLDPYDSRVIIPAKLNSGERAVPIAAKKKEVDAPVGKTAPPPRKESASTVAERV